MTFRTHLFTIIFILFFNIAFSQNRSLPVDTIVKTNHLTYINGKKIIPISKNKLIIGSTDEYSTKPEKNIFEKITNFLDKKPTWLINSQVTKKWFGIRSKPEGEPSPIMKNFGDGLIICTGFYKNGILLAPACSKWVSNEIKNYLS